VFSQNQHDSISYLRNIIEQEMEVSNFNESYHLFQENKSTYLKNRSNIMDSDPYFGWSGNDGFTFGISLNKNDTTLASGGIDYAVNLWDISSGKSVNKLKGHTHYVMCVAFSADGTKIASGSVDYTVKLWNIGTGSLINTLKTDGIVYSVAFSPDGTKIIAVGENWSFWLWEVSTGNLISYYATAHSGCVNSVIFSPDGKKFATASNDKKIKIWDTNKRTIINTFTGHTSYIMSIAFSPDGTKIVSGSADETVKIWDINTGNASNTLTGHTGRVISVVFSPDGTKVASGSWDGTIKIWDVITGQLMRTIIFDNGYPYSICFNNNGDKIISGGHGTKNIRLYNIETNQTYIAPSIINSYVFQLYQNYPNPFNPSTVIGYQLPNDGNVVLKIYNNLGQEIQTIIDKYQKAGYYSLDWQPKSSLGGLPSGVYYYRIQAGKYFETRKMLYLR
jgi:WD40 repeat protein